MLCEKNLGEYLDRRKGRCQEERKKLNNVLLSNINTKIKTNGG
jgi:hypothetical protein